MPSTHVLSHSDHRRYINHSSDSDSSLHSNLLEQHEHGPVPPNQFEMNFNRNGRVRKQFIDTSSHAFSNPSNHSLGSNQNHFVSDSHPASSPSARTPPTPETVRRNPALNFENDNPHPPSYPPMPPTKPQTEPPTGEKWVGRDGIKSSSANNDSGYVEHELSDSDEYFFKDKHERLV